MKTDYEGYILINKGDEDSFRKKTPGRWMIDRATSGKVRIKTKAYAYFTCPYEECGGINKAVISAGEYDDEYEDEKMGMFHCIYCSQCNRNMSIRFTGNFMGEWVKGNHHRRVAT